MAIVKTLSVEKQDKLEDGLLKVDIGTPGEHYVDFSVCSKMVGSESKAFSDLSEQDKLNEDSIKLTNGEYFPIKNLGEIETITDIDVYPKDSDDEHFFGYGRGCFVATVVYRSAKHPNVLRLQEFKRDVLMHIYGGRMFVSAYYSGAGKGIAHFIEKHLPSSIPVIRKCLDFVVDAYSRKGQDLKK
ncbi:MAG: CFI-box-CTERM domain-containing protein [Candidatus Woesearchaeota archaeon]|nr:CFI-box-CTERM domain-containing protein [Candidatus Woesearchaeota archaeon]